MDYNEIFERIKETKGFKILDKTDKKIEVYDSEEDKFLTYRNLESFNLLGLFSFSTLSVNKRKFLKLLNLLDKNLFMKIKKIYLINNEDDLDKVLTEYPCQYFDIESMLGINFYEEDVILINSYLAEKLAWEDTALLSISFHEAFNIIIWETLIHELRHNLVENPIITEEEIPIEENAEDKVEKYCLRVFDNVIEKQNCICFSI